MWWALYPVLLIISIVLIDYSWKKKKMEPFKSVMFKKISVPFLGHTYIFLRNIKDRFTSLKMLGEESYKTGGLLAYWHGSKILLSISDAEEADVVLRNCLNKDEMIKILRTLIGNGSIFADVDIWRPRRKLLAPTFSLKNLNEFVKIFARQSSVMVDNLKSAAGTGAFSIWQYSTSYTMDAVCETTLGIQVKAQQLEEVPLLKAIESAVKVLSKRNLRPWLSYEAIFRLSSYYKEFCNSKNTVINFVDEIVQSKINKKLEHEKNNTTPENTTKSFFDLMLESSANTGFGRIELREETIVMILAGTDTSAVGASFASVMLSRHQDIQEKCYEELKEIFGTSDRPVSPEDLPRMKYLDVVLKETLRLYPPVPFILRKADREITLPSGITLPKGCGIIVSIFAIQRNPKYWGDDAEQFRPDRFLDAPPRHPTAFLPFSSGPRACLGYQYAMMSMKTSLASLLRNYRLLPATDEEGIAQKPLRLRFEVMLKDIDKYQIRLEARQKEKSL